MDALWSGGVLPTDHGYDSRCYNMVVAADIGMSQTKMMSAIEVGTSTFVKFIWAMILWQGVAWMVLGERITLDQNFLITGIFTINSLIVGYIMRRVFDART